MRSTRPAVSLVVLATLVQAGCATSTPGSIAGRHATPASMADVPASTDGTADGADTGWAAISDGIADAIPAPAAATTTSSTVASRLAPSVPTGEVDSLLAELDARLAGLDTLLNDATAALAGEEGEILP